jgi:hypothetical protein
MLLVQGPLARPDKPIVDNPVPKAVPAVNITPPAEANIPAAEVMPSADNSPALPATKAPIQVVESVPAMYPLAAVDATHAPEECTSGIAINGSIDVCSFQIREVIFKICQLETKLL